MRKLHLVIPMILACAGTAAPYTKNTDQAAIEQSVDRALNVTTLTPKKVVWMRIGHVLDNVSCRVYPVVSIAADGTRTASIAVVVMGELSGGWSFASVTMNIDGRTQDTGNVEWENGGELAGVSQVSTALPVSDVSLYGDIARAKEVYFTVLFEASSVRYSVRLTPKDQALFAAMAARLGQ